ncbi:MAG: lipoyl synthase [Planctomycetota bacterium]
MEKDPSKRAGFPPWLKQKIPSGGSLARTRGILEDLKLDTVCSGARCPNRGTCFARGTATFLILGPACTRACRFCSIEHGEPTRPDPTEPDRVAKAVQRMNLSHAVVTSVTRDDLADGGAGHFASTICAVRENTPRVTIEVLTPDFQGDREAVRSVAKAGPDVYNHNVETVPSLYPTVRPGADYRRSLAVLGIAKKSAPERLVKSGLMLGLGEKEEEVEEVLLDLRGVGCDLVTLGQYLKPAGDCLEVQRYVPPEEFDAWASRARAMGFRGVASSPFVRSSYKAEEMLES